MPTDIHVEVHCAVDPVGADPTEVTAFVRSTDGTWEAKAYLLLDGGQLTCRRFDLGAASPGITSSFLRTIPMGLVLAKVRAALAEYADLWDEQAPAESGGLTDFAQAARTAAQNVRPADLRRGRPGYPDAHYERIAYAYLALQSEGWSRGLRDELARREGRPPETIRDWIHGARKRGFLSAATPGRPGALPGPRLNERIDNDKETTE